MQFLSVAQYLIYNEVDSGSHPFIDNFVGLNSTVFKSYKYLSITQMYSEPILTRCLECVCNLTREVLRH